MTAGDVHPPPSRADGSEGRPVDDFLSPHCPVGWILGWWFNLLSSLINHFFLSFNQVVEREDVKPVHQPHPTERDRWRERKKSNSEVVRKNRQKTLCPVPEDAPVFGRWQGWVDKSLPGGLFLGWEVNVNRILSSLSAVLKRWIIRGQQGKTAVNHFPTKATRDLSETHPTCPYSSKNQ